MIAVVVVVIMVIFYKYCLDGVLHEDCSGIEQLPNGKAQTIMAALLHRFSLSKNLAQT